MRRKGRSDRGRPRTEGGIPTSREIFEGFCCAQVERVQITLSHRYGHIDTGPGHKHYLMPQNDHFIAHTLQANAHKGSKGSDTACDIRGSVGYEGPKRYGLT